MKKNLCSYILIIMILLQCTAVFADDFVPSDWAKSYVHTAYTHGIVSQRVRNMPYNDPISRKELCAVMLSGYNSKTGEEYSLRSPSPFADTDDYYVASLYELGVVNGVDESTFQPERSVTREEIAKLMCNLSDLLSEERITKNMFDLSVYRDYNEISEWAMPYVAALSEKQIIKGDDLGNFMPKGDVTVEQSVTMLVRALELPATVVPVSEIPLDVQFSGSEMLNINYTVDANNNVTLTWDGIGNRYNVQINEMRRTRYPEDFSPNPHVVNEATDTPYYQYKAYSNVIYTITVTANDFITDTVQLTTYPLFLQNRQLVYPYGEPESEDEAKPLMEEIVVNGWSLNDGVKTTKKFYFTVHSALADVVKQIFDEIYNDGEQFPFKNVGSYVWREPMTSGRLSEHNLGTAIDINYDENYCLYNNGSAIGKFWMPYENPYSIIPYGSVVRTFEKYGFVWGGDAWSNPKDYMHFSYFGT